MRNKVYHTLKFYFNSIRKLINIGYFTFTDNITKSQHIRNDKSPDSKVNLVIKLDAIGDYILFRAFILKIAALLQDEKFVVITNVSCKNLIESIEQKVPNIEFYYINRERFHLNRTYRKEIIYDLIKTNYNNIINASYSRHFLTDRLVNICNGKNKIGHIGDLNNIRPWAKAISDKYYSDLISTSKNIEFEFERNDSFFTALLQKYYSLQAPDFKKEFHLTELKPQSSDAAEIIINPGASSYDRIWSPENYYKVINDLLALNYRIAVIGNIKELDGFNFIERYRNNRNLFNLVGKTTLSELTEVINSCKLLISAETATVHIAAMLNKNCICISNGNHYGRFHPYPKNLNDTINYIYPREIRENSSNQELLKSLYGKKSDLNINSITPKEVLKKAEELLKNQK